MEEVKKYTCVKCNFETKYHNSYSDHLESYFHKTRERKTRSDKKVFEPIKCEKCDFQTTNQSNYLSHKLHNHSSEEERSKSFTYYCKSCCFGSFTESTYTKHIGTKRHKMKSC